MPSKSNPVEQTCIGRFSIDWPDTASINPVATFQKTTLDRVERMATFSNLENKLGERADHLKEQSMEHSEYSDKVASAYGLDPGKMYAKTRLIDISAAKPDVLLGYHNAPDKAEFTAELHHWDNQRDYVFTSSGSTAEQYPSTSRRMTQAVDSFRPLSRDETPSTAGFCAVDGIFTQPVNVQELHESFTLVARFPDHPGAKLIIDSHALASDAVPEEPLKNRVDAQIRMLKAAGGDVDVLKRGEYPATGQNGYEVALAIKNDGSYKFFWSAQGERGDAQRPALEIILRIEPADNGDTSFKDAAQALAFWRNLLASIRPRAQSS